MGVSNSDHTVVAKLRNKWGPYGASSDRQARKETHMSFTLYVDDNCPKCRKPTMQAVVELHPTNPDLALQNFECTDCGPVKAKIISLAPKTDSRPGDVSGFDQTATA
jgi:hypothetical protein